MQTLRKTTLELEKIAKVVFYFDYFSFMKTLILLIKNYNQEAEAKAQVEEENASLKTQVATLQKALDLRNIQIDDLQRQVYSLVA